MCVLLQSVACCFSQAMLDSLAKSLRDFSQSDFETSAIATLEQDLFYLREQIKLALEQGLSGRSPLMSEASSFLRKIAQRRSQEMAKAAQGATVVRERKKAVTAEISQSYAAYRSLLKKIEQLRNDMKNLQTQAQLKPKERKELLGRASNLELSTAALRLRVGEFYAKIRNKRSQLAKLSLALTSVLKSETADMCRRFEASVKIQRAWRVHRAVGKVFPWLLRLNGQFELRQRFLFQYINTLLGDSSQIRSCKYVTLHCMKRCV